MERGAEPRTSRGRRLVRGGLMALGAVVLALGAGLGALVLDGRRAPEGRGRYVALGSSFAAGPGVGHRAANSPTLCMRSAANYPHHLAERRNLELTDVTCSGATALNLLEGGPTFEPPQLDALREDTELVTVTVGGNDVAYLGNLLAWSCAHDRARVPWLWRASCHAVPDAEVDRRLEELPARLEKVAAEVRRRAPRATLVFVDYTTVLPEEGDCPAKLPLTPRELDRGRHIASALSDLTATTATRAGALLVRASEVTRGHDLCAADPWVYGLLYPATPLAFEPFALHPTEAAMRAIAEAIDEKLQHP